ncbi:MAG: SUMF1/EgtB/PvdO family nonheme iron enzyme [Polyangiaceae bacterium]
MSNRSAFLLAVSPAVVALVAAACSASPASDASNPVASHSAPPPVVSAAPTETAAPVASASATPAPSASAVVVAPPPKPECPDGMVKVKGGHFEAGAMKRKVDIKDLCVDKTEVTTAAYTACVQSGKCTSTTLDCGKGFTYGVAGAENKPIVCVDYSQAKTFCEQRGARLPLDEEWEWVGRNGDEGRKYAWGNEEPKDQACWSGEPGGPLSGPCEVGSHPGGTNPQGIVDLTGNVFEWTSSKAAATGTEMVCHGGSWKDGSAQGLPVARPGGFKQIYKCGYGGMRCFMDAPPTP